ncbi:phytanoyl-CoA dioxygenase family protein [bacterium]|jgi:phytanoyl-CoA hydroxylase|nr:phytanoyl-CoA dioxygenase family protein [bacterium]
MKNNIGVIQGRLLPKYQERYQAHSINYSQEEYAVEGMENHDIFKYKSLYEKNGFVILKGVIEKKTISDLLVEVEKILVDPMLNRKRDLHYINEDEISSMHNIADYSDYYKSFIRASKVSDFFRAVYGEPKEINFNSSYFAKPRRVGILTKPHQDNAFFCMEPPEVMTCWFPVNFADSRNGAIYYYKGSHKEGNIQHEPQGNLGASMCISVGTEKIIRSKYDKVEIQLEATDCVLHNPLVVHGSDENKSAFDRKAFNFSIASIRTNQNKKLFAQYKNKFNKFLDIMKK